MEVLLGLVGKDFILAGTDTSVIRSITVLKDTEDKSRPLNAHNVLLYSGEPGDTVHFAEYIQKNSKLFTIINNGLELTTSEVTSFTRKELAQSLRSRVSLYIN
jgi:20S proteasome subunit beta 4